MKSILIIYNKLKSNIPIPVQIGIHTPLVLILMTILIMVSCRKEAPKQSTARLKYQADSIISLNNSQDSLLKRLDEFIMSGNVAGEMLARKEIGKRYRESSRFKEAIEQHKEALRLAEQLKDTFEIIHILNQLGTNFRRIGFLDEASKYHYTALEYYETYSDTVSHEAKKNMVVSLNGIGNIYSTLKNYDIAEQSFREALKGEKYLNSDIGQAINYANLGSIFEAENELDSALYYYRMSMKHNKTANSRLGISICYNHFGRLAEKRGAWDEALRQYTNSYKLMSGSKDMWHILSATISIARVNLKRGNMEQANEFINKSLREATKIQSWVHMSEAHYLKSEFEEKQGNYHSSLEHYKLGTAYEDSVNSEKNMNQALKTRIDYIRDKSVRELSEAEQKHLIEQHTKNTIINISIVFLILATIAIIVLIYALHLRDRAQRIMQKIEEMRMNFFTNITHEFRTPLTVILGLAEQIEKKLPEEFNNEKKELEVITKQGNSLLQLVNQLLDIAKVKSAVGTPDWRNGNIVAMLRMVTENMNTYATQNLININMKSSSENIDMDFVPDYMQKIISNILSNSIKYTPHGGYVKLNLKEDGSNVIITITDNGEGISAEELPHIFTPFYQCKEQTGQGTGIGLSLVKQMTEAMKGEIKVSSIVKKGTTFTLTFPLHQSDKSKFTKWIPTADFNRQNQDNTENENKQEDVSNEKITLKDDTDNQEKTSLPTILIVEDNTDIAYYIGTILEDKYKLFYAHNGKEAIKKAEEYMPDLIVTDLMMPEMDGYQLCNYIRNSEILNHIPIIILTARSDEQDKIKGLNTGADDYIVKPFNPDIMKVRIEKLLEQRKMLREKYSQAIKEGKEATEIINIPEVNKEFIAKLNKIILAEISNTELNSEILADKLCMSKSQLNRKVKSVTDIDTANYIKRQRLSYAQTLLQTTDEQIGDIVIKCGFGYQSYFNKAFKQQFGVTPSQYRAQFEK